MRVITYRDALREAIYEEMNNYPDMVVFGEDIGVYGGAYAVTKGLIDIFGEERICSTPMSEAAIVGMAAGAAVVGMRTIAEIMYIDFITLAMDQIVNQVAKMRYMFGGRITVPLVIRTQGGAGRSSAAQHSQSLETWFIGVPGLKVVIPSTPYDAKGLLKAAIRDDNPVLFIEHKMLYSTKGPVPEETYTIEIGKADVKREGCDVTIISYSRMLSLALEASKALEQQDISAHVLDLRTLNPLDRNAIMDASVRTGRVIVVEEGCKTGGVGAEISAIIHEGCFASLKAPVRRVAGKDVPIPCTPPLEKASIPCVDDIITAVKDMLGSSPKL
ncbi:MAG: alpha-ketoacid dehydrogenase subunit beta [Oscillospiraceae bacterium]|nr:alpha-ketoacid dehydrogenase subunit beta [Oscillospiraceae bacterium]